MNNFTKDVDSIVRIPEVKSFAFIDDVFVHPSLVAKLQLKDGLIFKEKAIRSYNQEKKQWGLETHLKISVYFALTISKPP